MRKAEFLRKQREELEKAKAGGKKKYHGIKLDAKRLKEAESQELAFEQEVCEHLGGVGIVWKQQHLDTTSLRMLILAASPPCWPQDDPDAEPELPAGVTEL
eukprot:1811888-Pyramimonas_sp.AAC.2